MHTYGPPNSGEQQLHAPQSCRPESEYIAEKMSVSTRQRKCHCYHVQRNHVMYTHSRCPTARDATSTAQVRFEHSYVCTFRAQAVIEGEISRAHLAYLACGS